MAHKGYTVPYFINFFESIPDHRWTEGNFQKEGTVQKCALGHAGSDSRAAPDSHLTNVNQTRVSALTRILGDVAGINDGTHRYRDLGKTPRGRILRALRNKRRTGNILGEEN